MLLSAVAFAQQQTEAIPLLQDESAMPRLYSAEITGEGQAKGRSGKVQAYRDYRSQLLFDPDSGALAEVSWTFFQRPDGVVPSITTTMTGDPAADSFGYVNGFLLGFVANVCFGIGDEAMTNLGNWYVETLGNAADAGEGAFARRFGGVNVSLQFTHQAEGASRVEQEVWREGALTGDWPSYCTLEAGEND